MKNHIFLLLLGVAIAAAQNSCPPNFVRYGNSCYYFGRTRLNFFDADQYCTFKVPGSYNVHLVALETGEETRWLNRYIDNDSELRNSDYWLSGDKMSKRGWVWSANARPVIYSNWASGEPNDSGKCMMAWYYLDYLWDDVPCYDTYNYFVCELEL